MSLIFGGSGTVETGHRRDREDDGGGTGTGREGEVSC